MARLPRDGGLGGQDARLMAALEWVRGIENGLLAATGRKGDPTQELADFRATQT